MHAHLAWKIVLDRSPFLRLKLRKFVAHGRRGWEWENRGNKVGMLNPFVIRFGYLCGSKDKL